MISHLFLFVFSMLFGSVMSAHRPDFPLTARVKPHRAGATGELVKGEEDLRKIILQWDKVPLAEGYEICHNCMNIDDETGEETADNEDGKLLTVGLGPEFTCGNRPCLVMPGAPLGYNRFNLRVKVHGEWSPWSEHRNYNVGDVFGTIEHEEL